MYAAPLRRLGALQPRPKGTSSLQNTPQHQEKSSLCSTATARRVAPVGLYSSCSSLPRVWSPLQGYTPWALKRIAPIGAQPCRPRLLAPPLGGAYYSALGGTALPWGACTHVPVGTQIAAPLEGIPLSRERNRSSLGGTHTTYTWKRILQHLGRKYRRARGWKRNSLGADARLVAPCAGDCILCSAGYDWASKPL